MKLWNNTAAKSLSKPSLTQITSASGKVLPLVLPPMLTMLVFWYLFGTCHMYPFGSGSVAWCDMNRQVVPLLMDFQDILHGKDSLWLNMQNAGGMNFWGVFCFFLTSPFSLLAAFVPKEDMLYFANILVILKLTLCSFTAAVYFRRQKKAIGSFVTVPLSLMYAFCGYGMLFYQNIMWLDVMALFPILMIGLEKLTKERKPLIYILSLSAITVMNFYLCYMVAVFILLYLAVFFISEHQVKHRREVCVRFLSGTLISILITAVFWLPSLIQVMSSGRLGSVLENLQESSFLSKYETVLPLLFCSAFLFVILIFRLLSREKKSKQQQKHLILFLLTLIPFLIEPINILWHTGNYMSFPARFGFITVFMGLICCADMLEDTAAFTKTAFSKMQLLLIPVIFALIYGYYELSLRLIGENYDTLTKYTATLWGKKESLDGLAKLFVLSMICYGIIWLLYRKRLIMKQIFAIMLIAVCCVESMNSIRIYMISPAVNNPVRTEEYVSLAALHDKIADNSFYRVKTDFKNADYNITGSLGYPSVSHYTSLTNRDFMEMQRRLGYSTVWMKSGSNGGTELTDALYSIRYILSKNKRSDQTVYFNRDYAIRKLPQSLDLGILCDSGLTEFPEIPENFTRAQIQQYLFETVFHSDQKLIREYDYQIRQSAGITKTDEQYHIRKNARIRYVISVSGKQSLYADCFNGFSNQLSEDFFKSLNIKINDRYINEDYPGEDSNGLLKLGEFENQTVRIEMIANRSIDCYSFGVFGLKLDVLSDAIQQTQCVGLQYNGHALTGSFHADQSRTCLLTVPYQDGIVVRVNGNTVPVMKVLSDWTAFELTEGDNDIEIYLVPKGFFIALILTVIGVSCLILCIIFRKKLHFPKWIGILSEVLIGLAALGCIIVVYVFPMIMSIISI